MMNRLVAVLAATCLSLAACSPAPPAQTDTTSVAAISEPTAERVGDCVDTSVASIGSRLEGVPDSGSSILYANGKGQVSYDAIPGIDHSRAGDAIHLCLASIPENCPPGDDRGRVYTATNARTNETWTAPDSQHMCGGA